MDERLILFLNSVMYSLILSIVFVIIGIILVTKVWDRFSASDMRHDIKLPSVARLSEKERVLLNSSAEPVTMRLELEPEPHLVLTVNGALAGRFT